MPHLPTKATRNHVLTWASYGISQSDIARSMGIGIETLTRNYRNELDLGATKAIAQVAGALFRLATTPGRSQAASCMFWLKTRAGWRETDRTELTGADGGPIETTDNRDKLARLIAGYIEARPASESSGKPH